MSNYLISISKNEAFNDGTIHDPDSKLKVRVFDPLKSNIIPDKGEIRFFVTSSQETLAFETKGYKKHRKLLILQMISRYCIYLGLIEVQIHSTWPFDLVRADLVHGL
jgi:hypothetical protein